MLQLKVGVQLASLRQPFRKAVETAATLGANAVEIDARNELHPRDLSQTAVRQINRLLEDHRLQVSGLRFPTRRGYHQPDDLDRRVEATKQAMSLAYQLKAPIVCNDVGVLPADESTPQWDLMVQVLHDLGRFGQRVGCRLATTTGRQDPQITRQLINRLLPGDLSVDFDPAELLIHGHSPEDALELLGADVVHVRARDAVQDFAQGKAVAVQLGRGSVDYSPLLGRLEEHRYTGVFTLQCHDQANVQELEDGVAYLKNLWA